MQFVRYAGECPTQSFHGTFTIELIAVNQLLIQWLSTFMLQTACSNRQHSCHALGGIIPHKSRAVQKRISVAINLALMVKDQRSRSNVISAVRYNNCIDL